MIRKLTLLFLTLALAGLLTGCPSASFTYKGATVATDGKTIRVAGTHGQLGGEVALALPRKAGLAK